MSILTSAEEILCKYDLVLLDTSACIRTTKNGSKVDLNESIQYSGRMTVLIDSHPNIRTLKGVVKEIGKGWEGLERKREEINGREKKSLNRYLQLRKKLLSIIEPRIVDFSSKERIYFNHLYDNLSFLRSFNLSDTDYSIVIAALTSAAFGSTAVLSNDRKILKITLLAEEFLKVIPNACLYYELTPYTSLDEDHFYAFYYYARVGSRHRDYIKEIRYYLSHTTQG
jgi:hypothetical protein